MVTDNPIRNNHRSLCLRLSSVMTSCKTKDGQSIKPSKVVGPTGNAEDRDRKTIPPFLASFGLFSEGSTVARVPSSSIYAATSWKAPSCRAASKPHTHTHHQGTKAASLQAKLKSQRCHYRPVGPVVKPWAFRATEPRGMNAARQYGNR